MFSNNDNMSRTIREGMEYCGCLVPLSGGGDGDGPDGPTYTLMIDPLQDFLDDQDEQDAKAAAIDGLSLILEENARSTIILAELLRDRFN